MNIIDYLGNMKALVVKVHNAELKHELLTALIEAQSQVSDLLKENMKLRAERDAREEVAEIRKNIFFVRNAYWDKRETIVSCYCQPCWDTKKTLVRLMRCGDHGGICNSCKTYHPCTFDGPRPNEGDEATPPEKSEPIAVSGGRRRQSFRDF